MSNRTPESVVWVALRDAVRASPPLSYTRMTDLVMRALTEAGFSVEDTLLTPVTREMTGIDQGCVSCGTEFPQDSGHRRQWAACFDGQLWRMYEYLPGMPYGPYCTACTGPELNRVNRRDRY